MLPRDIRTLATNGFFRIKPLRVSDFSKQGSRKPPSNVDDVTSTDTADLSPT